MLYHYEIYIPEYMKAPCFEGLLIYTRHAIAEAQSDKYGLVQLPERFCAAEATLIEVEVDNLGLVIKQVWRRPYDQHRDLILVIMNTGVVRTVWFNKKTDTHKTLNVARYVPHPASNPQQTVRNSHQANNLFN